MRRGRPGALPDPAARQGRVLRRRADAVLHPDPEGRLAVRRRRAVLEPRVPPSEGELKEAHGGPGQRHVGVAVRPLADQAPARHGEPRHEPRHRVGVRVEPSADGEDRALDRREVLAHRALPPEGIAALVPEPGVEPEATPAEAGEPQLAPAVAHDGGVRRTRVVGEHRRGPAQVVEEERAAHVVDVVRVAVVGRARREDRAERGRPAGRDLERVEAAPGVAHHPHPAGAPRLGGEPGDDLHRVVLLEGEVLVGENALRVAAAAHVDAHARVAVPGDVGMRERVPLRGSLAPAVGQILENGRHRARLGADREPHARREPRPVLQRDPDRITPLDRARERAHGGHGAALYRLAARARSAGRAAQIGRSEPRDRRYPEGSPSAAR